TAIRVAHPVFLRASGGHLQSLRAARGSSQVPTRVRRAQTGPESDRNVCICGEARLREAFPSTTPRRPHSNLTAWLSTNVFPRPSGAVPLSLPGGTAVVSLLVQLGSPCQINWDVLLGSSSDEGENEGDNDEDASRKPRPLHLAVAPFPKGTGATGGALEKLNPRSMTDAGAVTPPSTKDVEAVRALWQGFGLKEAERCEKSDAHLPANYPGKKCGPDSAHPSPGPNAADLGIAPGNLHRMGGGNFKPVNFHRLIVYQRNGSLLNKAAAPKFRVSAHKSAHSLTRSSASRHPNVVADNSLDTADTLAKNLNMGPHAPDAISGQEPSNTLFSGRGDVDFTRAPAVPCVAARFSAARNGWNKPHLATAADLANFRKIVDEPATPPDISAQENKSTDTDIAAQIRDRLESEIGILRSQIDRQREQLVLAEEHQRASAAKDQERHEPIAAASAKSGANAYYARKCWKPRERELRDDLWWARIKVPVSPPCLSGCPRRTGPRGGWGAAGSGFFVLGVNRNPPDHLDLVAFSRGAFRAKVAVTAGAERRTFAIARSQRRQILGAGPRGAALMGQGRRNPEADFAAQGALVGASRKRLDPGVVSTTNTHPRAL
ncbi:MAG: hypothetical protein BJ554DRAFT_7780, partial [Olpidium bornovanus]